MRRRPPPLTTTATLTPPRRSCPQRRRRSPSAPRVRGRDPTPGRRLRRGGQEFSVPESVLLGVSYLESRWDAHARRSPASPPATAPCT